MVAGAALRMEHVLVRGASPISANNGRRRTNVSQMQNIAASVVCFACFGQPRRRMDNEFACGFD